jgi:glyceraldehyde 3-phosphate dehydrogenase
MRTKRPKSCGQHAQKYRGRAAALNMVITETGAGSAVAKALPSLEGKLTSNAIRVPVPNGSLVVLNLEVSKTTSTGNQLS